MPTSPASCVTDVASGKTKVDQKTRKHGRAIGRGGIGAGTRTVGMLGAVLTYARENRIIETNPTHGIRKPAHQNATFSEEVQSGADLERWQMLFGDENSLGQYDTEAIK